MKFVLQKGAEPIRVTDEWFYVAVLAMMAAAVAAVVTSFALILHHNFLTIACDTAAVQNAIVNTAHGNWFRNTAYNGPNLLGVHTTFVLLLILPLYAIAPSVDTLFTLQIWCVYSTVIPIYFVAQHLLRRPPLAFCFAGAALASPLLLNMAVAPFHTETWIVAAMFWSYFFYLRNNLIGFYSSLVFALCCGEMAGLICVALGLALLLIKDDLAWRRRYGIALLVGGLAWVVLAVVVVGPFFRGSGSFNIASFNYTQWHIKTLPELAGAVFRQPGEAGSTLLSLSRWRHVAAWIGLPLLGAVLSWRSLILLSPFPIYFLMCNQEFYLYFHGYFFSFAFFAGYLGLIFFLRRPDVTDRFKVALVAMILLFNIVFLCGEAAYYINLSACRDDAFTGTLRRAFAEIPASAGVYGPHRYSAYLSNRQNMVMGDLKDEHFAFDLMLDERYGETNVHPSEVDYIVVDCTSDQCGCREGGYDPDASERRSNNINSLLQSGEWKMVFNQKNTVILQRAR